MSGAKIGSLAEVFAAYKAWVSRNPQLTSDLETTVKWVSYFLAGAQSLLLEIVEYIKINSLVSGRIQNSGVLSELVYLLSNLLVLFNDRIIHSARLAVTAVEHGTKVKTFLTVVEYSEVFLEIAARNMLGQRGKWLIIATVQIFK